MNVLIDTCFWFAYYDHSDNMHQVAVRLMDYLKDKTILIPYPTLYETINTKFAKRNTAVEDFMSFVNSKRCGIIYDDAYKYTALDLSFSYILDSKRYLSLVDTVIRLMLDDVNLKIDAVITFNVGDFFDVCQKRRIELIAS